MEKYYAILADCLLFSGFTQKNIQNFVACFAPNIHVFKRGQTIVMQGFDSQYVNIVLEGIAQGVSVNHSGEQTQIASFNASEIFGDVLSGSHEKSPITVTAKTDCTVMQLPYAKIVAPCMQADCQHNLLLQNLIASISDKYFKVLKRSEIICKKTLRGKISAFLLTHQKKIGTNTVLLDFNRTDLAHYLNCDRTALCRELKRMVDEKTIAVHKNNFTLLDIPSLRVQAL